MNSSYQTILNLLNKCIKSELDLVSFCEEFTLFISHTEDESLKESCAELFSIASDYMINQASKNLSPDTIISASHLLSKIHKT